MKQEESFKGKKSLLNKAEDVRKLESGVLKVKEEGRISSRKESSHDQRSSEQKIASKSESEESGDERMNPEEDQNEAKNGTLLKEDELISPENSADISNEEEEDEHIGSSAS